MVTKNNESRTVGTNYTVSNRKLYSGTVAKAWNSRHVQVDPNVSIMIPIAKGIPFPISGTEPVDTHRTRSDGCDFIEPLSEREAEVLALMAEGLANQEIGSRLFLSLNKVKVHARNIYANWA